MLTRAGFRAWLARPWTVVGIALAVVGILFVLVEAQSPSRLYWTGDAVLGHNRDGLVYYQVNGESYTVDDTRPVPAYNTPVTVYVDPADPSLALIEQPAKWIDAVAVTVWFLAAAGCLAWSGLDGVRRRRRRAQAHPADRYGEGLEADWVSRRLQRTRSESRRAPGP